MKVGRRSLNQVRWRRMELRNRRNQGGGGWRGNWSWRRMCRRSGESIRHHHVYSSRDMDKGTCKLRQVGEVPLLTGGPQRRHSKQSMSEWFVVSKYSKVSTFEHKAEMTEKRIGSQKFMVEGGVFLLSVR